MLTYRSSKLPSHKLLLDAFFERVGRPRSMAAVAMLSVGVSGCVTLAEQVSGEIETKRAACRQQVFKANVERAACHNAAEARLGEVWGSDLAAVRSQTRLVIAERQDRKELTEAEAELAFAKANADLTAQATRRA